MPPMTLALARDLAEADRLAHWLALRAGDLRAARALRLDLDLMLAECKRLGG
ncbi:hypothetical protein [Planktothrix phage Pra-JY27]|nr:hypothetical protein [Planktothrix phage Pag-Yong1]WEV89270.1 hypothetical protein [Synechococcus phage MinM2]